MSRWPQRTVAERFWSHVDKSGEHWLWTGSTTEQGYGTFRVRKGKLVKAHRMAWELEHGPVPVGQYVLHRCDIPPCVRHLFLGTQLDNVRDMIAKGRAVTLAPMQGEAHPRARMTEARVQELRALREQGWSVEALMRRYRLGETQVYRIIHRQAWSHVA